MAALPRIVIAGTGSGVGKTTVAVALARALARRGVAVGAFKVGPDFLDPTYLALASGRPCHNLDGWMMGAAHVAALFARAGGRADLAVVEGVMGLYDGAAASAEGSTAEVARLLAAPVILVANAHGMSRSFAALVRGYVGFEPGVRVAAVLANNVGSPRHGAALAESLRAAGLPPLIGALPRGAFAALPSRHLGLVSADRSWLDEPQLDALADVLERSLPLEAVLALAREAPELPAGPDACAAAALDAAPPPEPRLRLGVAFDEAFHFYYADALAALEAAGFDLVRFSPLRSAALPERLDGLYLGGGYPEMFAEPLAANEAMRRSVREFAGRGGPIYAECGGLMYLSRWIEAAAGGRREMCGVLPCGTRMLARRKALGYVEAQLTQDALWGQAGDRARGHEFHYSELDGDPAGAPGWRAAYALRRARGGEAVAEGYTNGTVLASYAHLHFGARPAMARRLHRVCAAAREGAR